MDYSVRIVQDSINVRDQRITTFLLTYPRFIHSELMTHRVFARNAASSRAIPYVKMRDTMLENPASPVFWGANQSGMQARTEMEEHSRHAAQRIWKNAALAACQYADELNSLGLHKQHVNRLLEPWQWMTTLLTGTDFENFFCLRAHEDAAPEFAHLANMMLSAYNASTPKSLHEQEWHIPLMDELTEGMDLDTKLKVCVARCARTSLRNFDGTFSVEKDVALYTDLSTRGHWSAFEHAALCSPDANNGPFTGWVQFRKFHALENRMDSRVIRKKWNGSV